MAYSLVSNIRTLKPSLYTVADNKFNCVLNCLTVRRIEIPIEISFWILSPSKD